MKKYPILGLCQNGGLAPARPDSAWTESARHLHASDYDAYIQRLRERIPEEKGISFEDFKQFCQFLNNLDDFSIAMRMYTFAGGSLS